MLIQEMNNTYNRKKRLNEAFGFGTIAFGILAIAGLTGLSYTASESLIEKSIARDPRVQQRLSQLSNMVANNPDKSPAEIAKMAAQTDSELAIIIQEIEIQAYQQIDAATDMSSAF
tara:strand:- start:169 stop:516 length:348 start_codon:yes stop_codon:yes gene_type:complete